MAADNEEIHEIHHQLAEDDGELVPGHERPAPVGRRYLGDIHRAEGRCHTHADTAQHTVEVECDQQALRGDTLGEEQELRVVGTQRAEEEEDTCNEQGFLAAQPGRCKTGEERADDTADQGAGSGESVEGVGVCEISSALEKGLEALFRAGDYSCVIPEQKAADYRNQDNPEQVRGAAVLSVACHYLA